MGSSAAGPIAPGLSYIVLGLIKGLPVLKQYMLFYVPACCVAKTKHGVEVGFSTYWALSYHPRLAVETR